MANKEYKVGDTIGLQLRWSRAMQDTNFKILFYNEDKSNRHEITKEDMTLTGNYYIAKVPHSVTKHWKPGTFTIEACVWTEDMGWVRTAKRNASIFVGQSETGGRL